MTDDKNKAAPAEFLKEEERANSINHTQSEADRFESGERNPDAAQETTRRRGRPPAQPAPNVTLSRANETEEEAKERGAKAKAHGGTNNEPGMDKPVPAATPQTNAMIEGAQRATSDYELVEDDKQNPLNEDGTPKPMVKKSHNEVSVRVTKKGDGQVSTGGAPGETYERGATFDIDRKIAEELEDRGFVEID